MYEEEYKVRFERLDGGIDVTDWMDIRHARRKFNALKKEKVLKTLWAELVYCPIEETAPDEETVIDEFARRKVDLFGKAVIVP